MITFIIITLLIIGLIAWFTGLSASNKKSTALFGANAIKATSVYSFLLARDSVVLAAKTGRATSKYSEETAQGGFDWMAASNTNTVTAGGAVKRTAVAFRRHRKSIGVDSLEDGLDKFLA